MKFYRVTDWIKTYENNRSRELRNTRWVPIHAKYGDGYLQMVDGGAEGALAYAGWIGLVLVACQCSPRGDLIQSTGAPHTTESIARKSFLPPQCIELAVQRGLRIGWLAEVDQSREGATEVRQGCDEGAESVRPSSLSLSSSGFVVSKENQETSEPFESDAGAREVFESGHPAWWGPTLDALNRWAVAARGHALNASSGDPERFRVSLSQAVSGPPIAGKPQSDFFVQAIDALMQSGTPWPGRGVQYAIKCIRNKLDDWQQGGGPPAPGVGVAINGRTNRATEQANAQAERLKARIAARGTA